jgi:hypothetical protein
MIVITLARKPPLKGYSTTSTCEEFGAGGLNIAKTRIPCEGGSPSMSRRVTARRTGHVKISTRTAAESHTLGKIERRGDPRVFMEDHYGEDQGRWPANLILEITPDCPEKCPAVELDRQGATVGIGVRVSPFFKLLVPEEKA